MPAPRACSRTLIALLLLATGCIGTDYINDLPDEGIPWVQVLPNQTAAFVDATVQFDATYYDPAGDPVQGVGFEWTSSDPAVADVDAAGLVTTFQAGQVTIVAHANGVTSAPALLTVVTDPNQVATVTVEPDSAAIGFDQTYAFSAVVRNVAGTVLTDRPLGWQSSDPAVATIDDQGLAAGLMPGTVAITATADGIVSAPAVLAVMGESRSGTFEGAPGTSYDVSGAATLARGPDGRLTLTLGDDFRSSSGPRLVVYLSPTNQVMPGSLSLGELQRTSGAQSYAVPAGVELTDFDWVIVHCQPFNVTFGFAELQ